MKHASNKTHNLTIQNILMHLSAAVLIMLSWPIYVVSNNNIHPVIDHQIYRSATLSNPALASIIRSKNIKTIINLRGNKPDQSWYRQEKQIADQENVRLVNIALPTKAWPAIDELQKLTLIIEKADKPILFHCRYGIDRTGFASAIAQILLMEPRSMEPVYRQISWLYLEFNPYSIGWLTIPAYHQWLNNHGLTNTRDNFVLWLFLLQNDKASLEA